MKLLQTELESENRPVFKPHLILWCKSDEAMHYLGLDNSWDWALTRQNYACRLVWVDFSSAVWILFSLMYSYKLIFKKRNERDVRLKLSHMEPSYQRVNIRRFWQKPRFPRMLADVGYADTRLITSKTTTPLRYSGRTLNHGLIDGNRLRLNYKFSKISHFH